MWASKTDEFVDRKELQNGQSVYDISVPISDLMSPGIWKLEWVVVGEAIDHPAPVPGDVTFEVAAPPPPFRLQAPKSVRAGNSYVFQAVFDELPAELSRLNCGFTLYTSLQLIHEGPSTTGTWYGLPGVYARLKAGQLSYVFSFPLAPDVPTGRWRGTIVFSDFSTNPRNVGASPCGAARSKGTAPFFFTVEPSVSLVTPTSAVVTINPSQAQLLLGAADHLRVKADRLKRQLGTGDFAASSALLRDALKDALTDVDQTESDFKGRSSERPASRAVDVFFDDIRLNYGGAMKTLAAEWAQASPAAPRLERAGVIYGDPPAKLAGASRAVLSSILHNAKAYEVVAGAGSLTFSLDVYSEPEGATICYRQTGQECKPVDHETDWRIENLPRAVYFIRLQKTGFRDKEVRFDAMDNTGTSVKVKLDSDRDAH